jgi:cobalt-zinc-cadmium efflux system protein
LTHSHSHAHSHFGEIARQTGSRLAIALGITLVFVAVEAAAGWYANSLALLSDAGHNLTDVIALAISWVAIRLSQRPSSARHTFGFHRAGILAALVNSLTLILMSLWIFYEAFQRLMSPPEVLPGVLVLVGALALAVNLGTALMIRGGSEHDLNVRSAFVHLMGDVFSTAGAILAGVVILFTGWSWLDPLVSILIGGLILWNAWKILRETADILLEATPRDVDMERLLADMNAVRGVRGVHDLHVWSINQSLRTLSAHIVTDDQAISAGISLQRRLNEVLAHQYGIAHATLQLECADCTPGCVYGEMIKDGYITNSQLNGGV